jgi:hypothetical protein
VPEGRRARWRTIGLWHLPVRVVPADQPGPRGRVRLDDLGAVMAGWYDDDEPGSPWRVSDYTLRNFAAAVGTVHAVERAGIALSHVPRRWSIRSDSYLTVRAETLVEAPAPVACGIPGFDQPARRSSLARSASRTPR